MGQPRASPAVISRIVIALQAHSTSLADALVRPISGRPTLAVGLIVVMLLAAAVDVATGPFQSPRVVAAIFDESAHLVTALLLLGVLPLPPSGACVAGVLIGAVGIDADHVPGELGWLFLTMGTNRPYSHSLLMVGLATLVANLGGEAWYRFAVGVAFGIVTHLLRDAATGGVPLFWPVSLETVALPYSVYATILILTSAELLRRTMWARRGSSLQRQRRRPAG